MLEITGEKTLGGYIIYLMHAASYDFAEPYCAGKSVLDLGCGSGYGSEKIARVADKVTAVDVSPESVSYASGQYQRSNLTFDCIKADESLPYNDGTFDVVISFQVIEHVEDHDLYLAEASRVLNRNGVLLLITPDRSNRLFSFQQPWNRYHLREYDMETLQGLTRKNFKKVDTRYMTGEEHIAAIELQRYRRMKWVSLPFTHKWLPDKWRVSCLNMIHFLKRSLASSKKPVDAGYCDFDFGSEVIVFGKENDASLNLVIVASRD